MKLSFNCGYCKHKFTLSEPFGKPRKIALCPNCGAECLREFNSIQTGSIIEDSMIIAADTILNGQLPSGKDKIVF